MILDNEEQRGMLLQLIANKFPGKMLEVLLGLKQSIAKAPIADEKTKEEDGIKQ